MRGVVGWAKTNPSLKKNAGAFLIEMIWAST
jgi:hypothetical protein